MNNLYGIGLLCVQVMVVVSMGSKPSWNDLKLRFKMFTSFPRTEAEAIESGFTKQSECFDNPNFRGVQYMKDNDPQVILLFDVNGFIAGLQAGIPSNLTNGYPSPNVQPPFIRDGDVFKLTAYFTDPSTICRRGRSEQRFQIHGTAEYLLIQNGTNPELDLVEIAMEESKTTWVKGKCFPEMGFHYFYNVHYDMDCSDFFPVALLYYHGELKGFVWSFGAVLNSTVIPYEHPEPEFFEELMEEVPRCLKTLYRSTLHVYFESKPEVYDCVNFQKPAVCHVQDDDDDDNSCASTAGSLMLITLALLFLFLYK